MQETPPESTLYPKITNHIRDVIKRLRYKLRDPSNPEAKVTLEDPIPIVGTIKLHGTHADILVHSNNNIVLQSRNNPNLLPTSDNQGFAASMGQKRASILSLRDQYLARWKDLNRGQQIDETIPVTIAGEWIGEKIQKGVAISRLSRRFVTISVKINGSWVLDTLYSDIEAPHDDIYNIARGGIYTATLHTSDPQRTTAELEPLAEKIAARCPFAESFHVLGEGEGLVWKLVPYADDADLWFKTKGGKFKPTFAPAPKTPATDVAEKREAVARLARAWVGEQRLEQGWDYLREMGVERSLKGIGEFLKWVQNDVIVEERGYVQENEVDEGMLRMEIMKVAKPWFLERVEREEEE
ncbi:hypothetical protein K505DRAFT_300420 [Melanomma pulvis-pyrius CBS 109.77]|uniref:Uncharacterized protein n=1 Tax=Melanomma pulvis-pyrius CBS 109.77 TaxID=1314802 RepID=A0A6A6XJK0_9PLEO|nr:hypothetical protein K505DRAFT_300420 [Melanomma pulvis-pyrius CBS 109.77]